MKLKFVFLVILISSGTASPKRFEFQFQGDMPQIDVKVTTENKKSETRKIYPGTKGLVIIEVLGGDEIAMLHIMKPCSDQKVYCEELDEIHIANPKPGELKDREHNESERGTYIEKIRRYDQPGLRGKTKFSIGKGWGIKGFFQVDPLP